MSNLRERIAIGCIASFFGTREGALSWQRILSSYGFSKSSSRSKTEALAHEITAIIGEEPDELVKFLNGLMKYHRLKLDELQELDSYLFSLGLRLENQKIEAIPPAEDFFRVFEESLKRPVARPATEGTKDGAILTLCEKINGMNKEFTLVDFGCGPGRLVYGLSIIDKQVLSNMIYIGVDINQGYLKEIEEAIRAVGFDKKVKNYHILSVGDFRKKVLAIDFVFMINVLHEINFLIFRLFSKS